MNNFLPDTYVKITLIKKVAIDKLGRDCILVNFAEDMMFLMEEEVRAHDSGFRLNGFRLRFQSHGLG